MSFLRAGFIKRCVPVVDTMPPASAQPRLVPISEGESVDRFSSPGIASPSSHARTF